MNVIQIIQILVLGYVQNIFSSESKIKGDIMGYQEDFISKLGKLAQAERRKRSKWVLPSVCIAQAWLGTGFCCLWE